MRSFIRRSTSVWNQFLASLTKPASRAERRQASRLQLTALERRDVMTAGAMMSYAWGDPWISGSSQIFSEGPSATYTVSLTLTMAPSDSSPVTIRYWTTDGTARGKSSTDSLESKDYESVDTTETFPNTSHLPTLTFDVYDDGLREMPETFVVHFECTTGNATLTNTEMVLTIIDNDGINLSGLADCPCACAKPGIPDNAPNNGTTYPVRYADGGVFFTETDLTGGGGGPFSQDRSWSNAAGAGYGSLLGGGWVTNALPHVVELDGGDTLVVVHSATSNEFFDFVGPGYIERNPGGSTLAHDTGGDQFVLTAADGTVTRFDDFDLSRPAGRWGLFYSEVDSAGNATTVTTHDLVGRITRIERSTGSWTDAVEYTYGESGDSGGQMTSVVLERDDGISGFEPVSSVEYDYYGASSGHGRSGDLRSATTKDQNGDPVGTTYYRYYTIDTFDGLTQIGYPGGLKFAFRQADYARLEADAETIGGFGAVVDDLTDEEILPYVGNYFEYDDDFRVTTEIAGGAGCSVCSGGQGEFTHAYTTSGNTPGPNSWAVKTVVTLPDDTTETVYTNERGNIMLKATTIGGQTWIEYWKYNADNQVILHAAPSAVSGYNDAYDDLVNVDGYGNAEYLRDDVGLLTAYTYYAATTATSSGTDASNPANAGGAEGYQQEMALRRGELGTDVLQQSWTYFARVASGITVYPVATTTSYRNQDGTGSLTTFYSYTWHSGTAQAATVTTALPTVTTAQNGPNVATASTVVYDAFGRMIWSKDADGFLTRMSYDDGTGAVIEVISDVNVASVSDEPGGWTTPGGGGKHLVTSYEVDSEGRATKTTDPLGRVTYTIYDDVNREVRSYAGWNTTTDAPTLPISVSREDRAGGYTETLTMSTAPDLDMSDLPTGGESIASLETLTRSFRNEAGQTVYTDTYFDFTGLSYSTSTSLGTEGTHFYRTYQDYDKQGRPNRTVSPAGTITRTVTDGQGRVISEWIGTDDEPTSDPWSPTNLVGTNMVKVRDYEYDHGEIGDGNLTKITEYPGLGADPRVTEMWYDWRNRVVATKGGSETTEDADVNRPLTYTDYNNLGQVVRTRSYDGDGVTIQDWNNDGVPDAPTNYQEPLTPAIRIGGTGVDAPQVVETTADGNGYIYVTGQFAGTIDMDPTSGTSNLVSTGAEDAFLAKYTATGELVWAVRGGGTSGDFGRGITLDSSGNIYFTGFFASTSTVSFGGTSITSSGSNDIFVWKLDSSGNTLWVKKAGSTGDDRGHEVAIRPADDGVVLTGQFAGTVSFGGTSKTSAGGLDIFAWALDDGGNTDWVVAGGGTTDDSGYRMAGDEDGNVYLTGVITGSVTLGSTNLTSAGSNDAFVWKLNSSGTSQWAVKGGGTGDDRGFGITSDGAGGVWVSGNQSDTATFGATSLVSAGSTDIYVWKLDDTGATDWAVRAGSTGSDVGARITADGTGRAWVVGSFTGTVNFGGITYVSPGGTEGIVWELDGTGSTTGAWRVGGTDNDSLSGIYYNADGSVYTTGQFAGTAEVGGTILTSAGSADGLIWRVPVERPERGVDQVGGSGDDQIHHMVIDSQGYRYVTGQFSSTLDFDPSPGGYSLTSTGGNDAFVAKYAPDGSLVWAKKGGGNADDRGRSIAVDSNGNVYVTGYYDSTSSVSFGGTNPGSASSVDGFVWKLSADGTTSWVLKVGSTGDDRGLAVVVDGDDDVYVAGQFAGTVSFGGTNKTSAGSTDAFIWKMDDAGTTDWVVIGGSTSADSIQRMTIDDTSLFVGGIYQGSATFGSTNLTNSGSDDGFVWKLDHDGKSDWAVKFGSTGTEFLSGLTVDQAGGVYAAGRFQGTVSFAGTSKTSVGSDDGFIWKLTDTGTTTWVRTIEETGDSTGLGVAVTRPGGGVYVVGRFAGTSDFEGTSLVSAGGNDGYAWSLTDSGDTEWVRQMGGTGNDVLITAALAPDGSLYAGGWVATGQAQIGDRWITAAGSNDAIMWQVSTPLRSVSETQYDNLGRAFRSQTYGIDPLTGERMSSTPLVSESWFDKRGNAIKQTSPGGLVQKSVYDGLGRTTTQYTTDGGGDAGWSDADDVTGDTVLSQVEYTYDDASQVIMTTVRERFHDASGTGGLGSPSSGIGARVSYSTAYYDLAGRITESVNVGTNGGSAYTRPGTVPTRSSTVLVSSYVYDDAGRVWKTIDAAGIETWTEYDGYGRPTKVIENYVDGSPSNADDKTTQYEYGAPGLTSITVVLPSSGIQRTEYIYGVTTGTGSAINSYDIVWKTQWPDTTTGAASSSEEDVTTVNASGQVVTKEDRNGNIHTITYDILGRPISDAVTTLGGSVDGSVRRIETAYDTQGNAYLITSYDAASSGNIVNQVKRQYNGLGQLTKEWQEHDGAVDSSTLAVRYTYSEMSGGANHSRLTSIIYPSGYTVNYNYASGLNSNISRLTSLSDVGGTLEEYDYLGLGTVVRRGHPQPNVDMTHIKQGMESNADAGDKYIGLDRFGRVEDQRWYDTVAPVDVSRYQYSYDEAGNRLDRIDLINGDFSEEYGYDDLNQLISSDRNSGDRVIEWDYDAVGNWNGVEVDSVPQTRTHNRQNEITGISGATTPTYDANGNMTGDETGKKFEYDAWNRLVAVRNSGNTLLKTYEYDGLGRRIEETPTGDDTTDLYYSAGWQVLEENVDGDLYARYVWSPVYVDAMVLRDRDSDDNGSLDERLYAIQDANFNVVALMSTNGDVVERYVYDAFGAVTVLDGSYGARGSSSYGWLIGFQGMRYDTEARLNFTWTRPYSPTLGRPIQNDFGGYAMGDMSLYRWELNNPVVFVDPTGFQAFGGPFDPRFAPGLARPSKIPTHQEVVSGLKPSTPSGGVGRLYYHYDYFTVSCPNATDSSVNAMADRLYNNLKVFKHFNDNHTDKLLDNPTTGPFAVDGKMFAGFKIPPDVAQVAGNGFMNMYMYVELRYHDQIRTMAARTIGHHPLVGVRIWNVSVYDKTIYVSTVAVDRRISAKVDWGFWAKGPEATATMWRQYLKSIGDHISAPWQVDFPINPVSTYLETTENAGSMTNIADWEKRYFP